MDLKINDIVILKTFFGTVAPEEDIDEIENYWKLIGSTGKIIDIKIAVHPAFSEKGFQVLVQFDNPLNKLNVISHNKVENSLWIFKSDLQKQDSNKTEN